MVGVYQPEYEIHYFGDPGDPGLGRPADPQQSERDRTINGREYEIYVDSDRIRMIAWHRGENTYWVSNSLLQSLTNDQMVGIAGRRT